MIADQPPQIIREITPELRAIIGCTAMWFEYRDGYWAENNEKNIEVYQNYLNRCLSGGPIPIHIREKK